MNDFYVYAHHLPDNTIFYIGKGKDKRVKSKTGRSMWWNRIVNKYYNGNFPEYSIISKNLSESEAFDQERLLIEQYGRRDISTGILVNMTDGGDGVFGHIMTEESKKKLSNSRRGMKFSEDHKQKMSDAAKKRVELNPLDNMKNVNEMCAAKRTFTSAVLENRITKEQVVVTSTMEFARKYNVNQSHISSVIGGKRKSCKDWILIIKRR